MEEIANKSKKICVEMSQLQWEVTELKNMVDEMNNAVEVHTSSVAAAEDRIHDLRDV